MINKHIVNKLLSFIFVCFDLFYIFVCEIVCKMINLTNILFQSVPFRTVPKMERGTNYTQTLYLWAFQPFQQAFQVERIETLLSKVRYTKTQILCLQRQSF